MAKRKRGPRSVAAQARREERGVARRLAASPVVREAPPRHSLSLVASVATEANAVPVGIFRPLEDKEFYGVYWPDLLPRVAPWSEDGGAGGNSSSDATGATATDCGDTKVESGKSATSSRSSASRSSGGGASTAVGPRPIGEGIWQ
eukprot:984160-Amphidinium_carterae.1